MGELSALSIDEFTATARDGGGVNSKNCAKLATALSAWQSDHPSVTPTSENSTAEIVEPVAARSDESPVPPLEEAITETNLQDDSPEYDADALSNTPTFLSPKGSGTPAGILGGVLAEADKASLERSAELAAEGAAEAATEEAAADAAKGEIQPEKNSARSPGEESEATATATEAAPQAPADSMVVTNHASEEDSQDLQSPRKRSSSAAASLFKGVDDEFGDDDDDDDNEGVDDELDGQDASVAALPSAPANEGSADSDEDSSTSAPLPGLGDGISCPVAAKKTATALQALRRVSVHGLTSPVAPSTSSNGLSALEEEARAAAVAAGAATLNFEEVDGNGENITGDKIGADGSEDEGEAADDLKALSQAGADHETSATGDQDEVRKVAMKRGSVCFQGTSVQGTRSPSMKQREAMWNRQLSGEPELLEDDDGENVVNDAQNSNSTSSGGFESEEGYLEQYLVPKFAHLLAMLERDENGFVSAFVADSGLGLLASALKHVVDSALVHATTDYPSLGADNVAADDNNAPGSVGGMVPMSPPITAPHAAISSTTPVSPLRMSHSGQGCSMSPAALTLQGLILAATLLVLDSTPGLEWALNNVEALSGIFISIQVI